MQNDFYEFEASLVVYMVGVRPARNPLKTNIQTNNSKLFQKQNNNSKQPCSQLKTCWHLIRDGGRIVIFLWGCGHQQGGHAAVDEPTFMCMWAALTGCRRMKKKNKQERRGEEGDEVGRGWYWRAWSEFEREKKEDMIIMYYIHVKQSHRMKYLEYIKK